MDIVTNSGVRMMNVTPQELKQMVELGLVTLNTPSAASNTITVNDRVISTTL